MHVLFVFLLLASISLAKRQDTDWNKINGELSKLQSAVAHQDAVSTRTAATRIVKLLSRDNFYLSAISHSEDRWSIGVAKAEFIDETNYYSLSWKKESCTQIKTSERVTGPIIILTNETVIITNPVGLKDEAEFTCLTSDEREPSVGQMTMVKGAANDFNIDYRQHLKSQRPVVVPQEYAHPTEVLLAHGKLTIVEAELGRKKIRGEEIHQFSVFNQASYYCNETQYNVTMSGKIRGADSIEEDLKSKKIQKHAGEIKVHAQGPQVF